MRKLKMHELNRLDLNDYRQLEKLPIVVALDNVRSAMNVGSVFRTSDAFKVQEVLLLGKTPSPEQAPEMRKTALGGEESVAWQAGASAEAQLQSYLQQGYQMCALEQTTKSIPLQEWTPEAGKPIILLFGNEVTGVSQELLEQSALHLEIPQFGTKHSINISVCAGIALWHRVQVEL